MSSPAPSGFVSETSPPEITFLTKNVGPPSNVYITREETLVVSSFNSVVGAVIEVRGRVMLPGGRVVPFRETHTPNTDRSIKTTTHPVPEGFLLDVMAIAVNGTPRRGQCFLIVELGRGDGAARVDFQTIIQGYVGSGLILGWPGDRLVQPTEGPGALRLVVGTVPGAGLEIAETVPTGARWRLNGIQLILNASATVATRRPILAFDDGAAHIYTRVPHPLTIAASAQGVFYWAPGLPLATAVAGGFDVTGIGPNQFMDAGFRVLTTTVNLQVGDLYAAPTYTVEEWINP